MDDLYGQCPKCGGNLAACMANGCPNDPKPLPEIKVLRAENYRLKSELTATQQRLRVAEGLLEDAQKGLKVLHTMVRVQGFVKAQEVTEQILAEITGFILTTPDTGDMVVVRREDLGWALKCKDFGHEGWEDIKPRVEAMERLEAAALLPEFKAIVEREKEPSK